MYGFLRIQGAYWTCFPFCACGAQPFWPSIVMKTWLNIEPNVYEFSGDEVDTETESEDDGVKVNCANWLFLMFIIWVMEI